MTWIAWLAVAFAALAIGALGLVACGHFRWIAATQALIGELDAARLTAPAPRYDSRELDGLPVPVQRYFRAALKDGQPIITAARIELRGRFNLSPTGERWKPFTSMQRAVTRRPGFVWDGHVALAPGIAVHVHDAYIAGVGILKPSLLGLYALADVHGAGETARDELMRYAAEAAWYPTALLPSQGVRWETVDDRSAKATLTDGVLSVTMLVTFDNAGMIESSRFEARGAQTDKSGGKIDPTPWEGRWSDYEERNGMRLPMTGEAAWLPATGRRPYFRGTVTSMVHEVSP